MTGLAILLLSSAIAFALAQRFWLPAIPLLILVGFGVSRTGVDLDREALNNALDLGLAFLVFSAGIELNPARFSGRTGAILWIAIAQFVVAGVLGFILAQMIGFNTITSLYLAAGLSTSSTLVAVQQIFRSPGSLRTYGRIVLSALLVQDVVIIVLIVLLPGVPGGIQGMVPGVIALAVMAAVAVSCQRFLPRLIRRSRIPEEETILLCSLALLFSFSGFAHWMGINFIAGGFAAGFALSGFPVSGEARSVLRSLNTFFIAIFFSALGAQVELPDMGTFARALGFSAIVVIATPIVVAVLAEWKGRLSARNAITAGLLLAQTSEFSVVLAVHGESIGQVSHEAVTIIALVAVITMTLTPLLATDRIARWLLGFHPLRRLMKTESELRDHVVVLGYGTSGRWVIRPLVQSGLRMVIVDQDAVIIAQLRSEGHECIRGDASDEKVLQLAGADRARFILVSLDQVGEIVKIIEHVGGKVPVFARTFEIAAAKKIEAAGGIPILNSTAAADRFMSWFEIHHARSAGVDLKGTQ
jgi:CPA2 family monovalent cation:H+ antiporter-2